MSLLALFGFICLYTDLTINQRDLLTFPNFIGYFLLLILLWILYRKKDIGKPRRLVVTLVCFILSLLKSLQDVFRFFGNLSEFVSLLLWLVQIAACVIVSWLVYQTALEYAQIKNPNAGANRTSVILTLVITAFFSLVSPFFSWLWEYSAYIVCGLRLLVALGLMIEVMRLLKEQKQ